LLTMFSLISLFFLVCLAVADNAVHSRIFRPYGSSLAQYPPVVVEKPNVDLSLPGFHLSVERPQQGGNGYGGYGQYVVPGANLGYGPRQPGGFNGQQPGGFNGQQPGGFNTQQPGGFNGQQPGGFNAQYGTTEQYGLNGQPQFNAQYGYGQQQPSGGFFSMFPNPLNLFRRSMNRDIRAEELGEGERTVRAIAAGVEQARAMGPGITVPLGSTTSLHFGFLDWLPIIPYLFSIPNFGFGIQVIPKPQPVIPSNAGVGVAADYGSGVIGTVEANINGRTRSLESASGSSTTNSDLSSELGITTQDTFHQDNSINDSKGEELINDGENDINSMSKKE